MKRQYLISPSIGKKGIRTNLLVVGSGIAGLMTALHASHYCDVLIITKTELGEGSSRYAQGGVAMVTEASDSVELHIADTLKAGAGFCDEDAVETLVTEGAKCFSDLIEAGAEFAYENGKLYLHREGGHSRSRVVHAGDRSGAEIIRALKEKVMANPNIKLLEHAFLIDLNTEEGSCNGALVTMGGKFFNIEAEAVVLASGGSGQLFSVTTNPAENTGDGVAAACRAGARVGDLEFIQFHPTAFHEKDQNPRFLISEAVRGEGAYILDPDGRRLMLGKHELAELAPRDVVVRNMAMCMIDTKAEHLYLDLRHIPREKLQKDFPTIYQKLKDKGLNIHEEPVPISFAAHYTIGGVFSDGNGCSSLPGLYACGEVSCTGVHGANRLASNSLLEGLVFSKLIASHFQYVFSGDRISEIPEVLPDIPGETPEENENLSSVRSKLTALMIRYGGVFRSKKRLSIIMNKIPELYQVVKEQPESIAKWELLNMLFIAKMTLKAAFSRKESRGTHQRQEFPRRNPSWRRKHIAFDKGQQFTINSISQDISW